MTIRDLRKDDVVEALSGHMADPLLAQCRAALVVDPRDNYAATSSPAEQLRRTLEVKHRVARTGGKTLIGDEELLLRLHELGEEPVTGVFFDDGGRHYKLYLRAWTLEPVGAVILVD